MRPPIRKKQTAPGPDADGKIRILLVDDHPVVREGIRSCLVRHPHFEIVGEATDGLEAIAQAKALVPDIILMDINVPRLNGLEATAAIRKLVPKTRVLALTAHARSEYAQRIIDAGARGYVLKDAAPQELISAIETVHHGATFFSPIIARGLLKRLVGQSGAASAKASDLSAREIEVLALIAEGKSNKDIAAALNLGVRTVETHRLHLMRKLGIRSVAGLTKYAITRGLVPFDESRMD